MMLDSLGRRNGKPLADRFWSRVEKSDGCWIWTGSRNQDGYGNLCIRAGKTDRAHRASWLLHNGDIPEGMHVCHHCDNPSCVRPDHLFLGTATDNMRDMSAKGRGVIPKRTVSDAQAREMRELHAAGASVAELSGKFGMHPHSTQGLLTGKTYRTAGGPVVRSTLSLERLPKSKLTWVEVDAMRARGASGATTKQVAQEFGVSEVQALRVLKNRSWVRRTGSEAA